jgi:hypothetical protein
MGLACRTQPLFFVICLEAGVGELAPGQEQTLSLRKRQMRDASALRFCRFSHAERPEVMGSGHSWRIAPNRKTSEGSAP